MRWGKLHIGFKVLIILLVLSGLVVMYTMIEEARSEADRNRIDLSIKAFGGFIVAVSALITVYNYGRNGRLERAKWLGQLHEKFFEKDTYIDVRKALDYNKVPNQDYVKLKNAIENKTDEDDILQERFVNYMNLFEYVATLWKNNQLEDQEVHMLFGYYLKNLEKHQWVMQFARDNEFKNLPGLITAVKNVEGRK